MKRESFMEFDSLALDLYFCSEILKLSSLHYGLWADPGAEALTLENLRAAQRRYTEALYRLVPAGTKSVLDVGCGLGDVARGLAARGVRVTAISPDKNHGRYVEGAGAGVRFVQARYQNFSSEEKLRADGEAPEARGAPAGVGHVPEEGRQALPRPCERGR